MSRAGRIASTLLAVYIDGVKVGGTVDNWASTSYMTARWVRDLPLGRHMLRIVPTGARNSQATDTRITVRRIDVY